MVQREEELRQTIRDGASAAKLAKAAERVRTAKMDIAKALEFALTQKRMKGVLVHAELITLERDTERWKNMLTEQIIELYRA